MVGWLQLRAHCFVMLSSAKLANRFCEMKERLSKRTQGYKRRIESLSRKPDAVCVTVKYL